MRGGNVLFITIDQLRADLIAGPLAAHVPTPNLDRLASQGTRFDNHFTVTVPCGPARASLLTGLYAMNHRSVRNGAPLARHHATIGTEMRKAGYEPLLFGYTDTTPDPTGMDPEDPDLTLYEGVAPGFRELVEMRLEAGLEWPAWLASRGHTIGEEWNGPLPDLYRPVPADGANAPRITDPALYSAEESDTAYLTDRTLMALAARANRPWFAHVTYIRPHPPLIAPAPYNTLVDPAALPAPVADAPDHGFVDAWFSGPSNNGLHWGFDGDCASMSPETAADLRAVYCGLLAEVDHHIGRLIDWLEASGQADRTLVIVTADHGEMLGDKRMWGKESVFEPAYRVPLIIRDPASAEQGRTVDAMTESIDISPTILGWVGRDAPPAMDGNSLLPWTAGDTPSWRDAAFMEVDFAHPDKPTRFQRHWSLDANHCHASILREQRWKYVQFAGGVPPMLFDLESDPGETRNLAAESGCADEVSRLARKMIDRMTERRDRRLTGIAIGD